MKLLWLSPNHNHYKAKFLNYLHNDTTVDVSVLAGGGRKGMGDVESNEDIDYQIYRFGVDKSRFGYSKLIRKHLRSVFNDFDWVLIPREKKNFLLIMYAVALRFLNRIKGGETRLVTYNHPYSTTQGSKITMLDKLITKLFYQLYDKVIFYTEKSYQQAIRDKVVNKSKAYWANNTIDTKAIEKVYSFVVPNRSPSHILFIGRLIPSKNVNGCIEFCAKLKSMIQTHGGDLELTIIGDGPDANIVKSKMEMYNWISWKGALIEEKDISTYMRNAAIVFVPGLSGLSINHAFCYGRPYATFSSKNHGPEIGYLSNGVNGFILDSSEQENLRTFAEFLLSSSSELYYNANDTGKMLSVENWCRNFEKALLNESID